MGGGMESQFRPIVVHFPLGSYLVPTWFHLLLHVPTAQTAQYSLAFPLGSYLVPPWFHFLSLAKIAIPANSLNIFIWLRRSSALVPLPLTCANSANRPILSRMSTWFLLGSILVPPSFTCKNGHSAQYPQHFYMAPAQFSLGSTFSSMR